MPPLLYETERPGIRTQMGNGNIESRDQKMGDDWKRLTESFSSLSFSLPIVERFTEKARIMKATYSQLLTILMDAYDGITK